ncbi:MAG: hypothetical protein J6E31_04285, partial [Pyramidobacter sp.]|nr:hypothetical protein [Pyramidobacter sp.]
GPMTQSFLRFALRAGGFFLRRVFCSPWNKKTGPQKIASREKFREAISVYFFVSSCLCVSFE